MINTENSKLYNAHTSPSKNGLMVKKTLEIDIYLKVAGQSDNSAIIYPLNLATGALSMADDGLFENSPMCSVSVGALYFTRTLKEEKFQDNIDIPIFL